RRWLPEVWLGVRRFAAKALHQAFGHCRWKEQGVGPGQLIEPKPGGFELPADLVGRIAVARVHKSVVLTAQPIVPGHAQEKQSARFEDAADLLKSADVV